MAYKYIVAGDETGHYRLIEYNEDKNMYDNVVDMINRNDRSKRDAIEIFAKKHSIDLEDIYPSK